MLFPGTRIGPYEVLAPLGAGGMGEVYRARDERLSREVALKVLPADLAADPGRLKRFEKEARSASGLNHPNIVTIYDIGSSNSVSYIAMERVEGKTLREVLADGPFTTKRLVHLAAQIADGLARAHEAGIVHRDLKPENVMVTRDGLVKVLDFGLAKLMLPDEQSGQSTPGATVSAATGIGVVVGTAGYMSPEQASGHPVDFRSDQFSLGAMLYEMATGRAAFKRATTVQTLAAIIDEEPEPIEVLAPKTPVPVRWITARCLAKDPDGRYASTRDLARDLATIRDRIAESSASMELSPVAPSARRRAGVAWALVTAAALISGAFLGRSLSREHPRPLATFHQVTFREESIQTARFAPDGQTIVYGTVREGKPFELFSTRVGSLQSRPFGLNADILSISSTAEMAILLGGPVLPGTLARVPLAGGAPREVLESVRGADWSADGKSLAVVRVAGGKESLEFPSGTVLFESTGFIGRPYVSRKGDRVLFRDGRSLSIVDPTRKVTAVGESLSPSGYGWSPDGEEVWMTVAVGSTTEVRAVLPGGRERVIATLAGTFLLQDVAPDGRILADRLAQRARMVALASGVSRETDLSWLDASIPADISSDGKAVLFTETGVGGGGGGVVYLRPTDGADAIRLGEGHALALSPDGKWALSRRGEQTILLPTGPGQPRPVASTGVDFERGATFLPDGGLLLSGGSPGHAIRLYALEIAGGEPRPFTPDGVYLPEGAHTVSPDGKLVAASDLLGKWSVYPIAAAAAGAPRPIAGLLAHEKPIRWSADGRSLFILAEAGVLSRLGVASGRREVIKEFRPQSLVFPTPDGTAFVYGYGSDFSNLFLIADLR